MLRLWTLMSAMSLLVGCGKEASNQARHHEGRYQGIGIATPGDQWKALADAPKPATEKAATLADDDYLVFVTDSVTGEVRECGDRSGVCVSVQPWTKDAVKAPVNLSTHAREPEAIAEETVTNDTGQ